MTKGNRARRPNLTAEEISVHSISFSTRVSDSDFRDLEIKLFNSDYIYFLSTLDRIELIVKVSNTYFDVSNMY